MKTTDFLILGHLGGFDLILAEFLKRSGKSVMVAREVNSYRLTKEKIDFASNFHLSYSPDEILWFSSKAELLKLIGECRVVITFGGSLIRFLKWRWLLRAFFALPPVINWHTGSDILERAEEKSLKGWAYRLFLNTVNINVGFAYPEALKVYARLNVPRLVFWHFPYLLYDLPVRKRKKAKQKLVFFHASHIDFKINNPGKHRKSSKGNDRFLRAFARALKDGLSAKCVILERGADVLPAKELIRRLGIEDSIEWKAHMSRDELAKEMQNADVVVDQFDVGGMGGIAFEAMSLAKPVLIWIDLASYEYAYPEPPPVLNGRDEEEIYVQLMQIQENEALLSKTGQAAKKWVYRYHGAPACLRPVLDFFDSVN